MFETTKFEGPAGAGLLDTRETATVGSTEGITPIRTWEEVQDILTEQGQAGVSHQALSRSAKQSLRKIGALLLADPEIREWLAAKNLLHPDQIALKDSTLG